MRGRPDRGDGVSGTRRKGVPRRIAYASLGDDNLPRDDDTGSASATRNQALTAAHLLESQGSINLRRFPMKQLKVFAVAALALFVSTSAMALGSLQSDTRSRPSGSVLDVILNRDTAVDARHDDEDWRESSKKQNKRERERAKELRKQEHERQKAIREDRREREKDLREAVREREKDRREAERERAKDARERAREHDRDDD